MSAISPLTNPHRLERPCYLFWNDEFTSRSNARKNHLWTSPEFPLVAPIAEGESFDSTYYDEDSDGQSDTDDSDVSRDPLDLIGTPNVPIQATIVVEGKRIPDCDITRSQLSLSLGLKQNLGLARQDIDNKKRFVFEIYRCASFIAITFAGPYWSFVVCRSNDSCLQWSRPIAAGTDTHNTILDTIFRIAESYPENPAADPRTQPLVDTYLQVGEDYTVMM
ncbi:hypothetical protein RhiXN_10159 [Rhizoctonia solani]|uniref:Uncharacterized protein n=1 Tax=Rhizoctonia solani TaxID=456999 RepID=A0A8H8P3L1_9AGAM|nr:uncharacterized protein RhiXN_10159 [Rhizoctonia solani]QRW23835.1 hypothetical protein RhiXN_10159 [Rhizoctonia solani]